MKLRYVLTLLFGLMAIELFESSFAPSNVMLRACSVAFLLAAVIIVPKSRKRT